MNNKVYGVIGRHTLWKGLEAMYGRSYERLRPEILKEENKEKLMLSWPPQHGKSVCKDMCR